MKKIVFFLLVLLFSTSLLGAKSSQDNNQKSFNFGLGFCQQQFDFEDNLLLFYNPYISINAEKKLENIKFLSFIMQNRIMVPSSYIFNYEDLNNTITEEKTFFNNPLSYESIVATRFSKQVYDEMAIYLTLGTSININQYEFYHNKYSNINFGFLLGWGYNYQINENLTFFLEINRIKYKYNIPFSGLYFNNGLAQAPDFDGDNRDVNISFIIKK
ncbi:MAG: hypothetical protein EOL97_06070 [Spirochaetia bacterium]|nr:hypothetical protein [Spirochaetia bacterium]